MKDCSANEASSCGRDHSEKSDLNSPDHHFRQSSTACGIKMFLLSQGSWVKVIAPDEFVKEMKDEIEKMQSLY